MVITVRPGVGGSVIVVGAMAAAFCSCFWRRAALRRASAAQ